MADPTPVHKLIDLIVARLNGRQLQEKPDPQTLSTMSMLGQELGLITVPEPIALADYDARDVTVWLSRRVDTLVKQGRIPEDQRDTAYEYLVHYFADSPRAVDTRIVFVLRKRMSADVRAALDVVASADRMLADRFASAATPQRRNEAAILTLDNLGYLSPEVRHYLAGGTASPSLDGAISAERVAEYGQYILRLLPVIESRVPLTGGSYLSKVGQYLATPESRETVLPLRDWAVETRAEAGRERLTEATSLDAALRTDSFINSMLQAAGLSSDQLQSAIDAAYALGDSPEARRAQAIARAEKAALEKLVADLHSEAERARFGVSPWSSDAERGTHISASLQRVLSQWPARRDAAAREMGMAFDAEEARKAAEAEGKEARKAAEAEEKAGQAQQAQLLADLQGMTAEEIQTFAGDMGGFLDEDTAKQVARFIKANAAQFASLGSVEDAIAAALRNPDVLGEGKDIMGAFLGRQREAIAGERAQAQQDALSPTGAFQLLTRGGILRPGMSPDVVREAVSEAQGLLLNFFTENPQVSPEKAIPRIYGQPQYQDVGQRFGERPPTPPSTFPFITQTQREGQVPSGAQAGFGPSVSSLFSMPPGPGFGQEVPRPPSAPQETDFASGVSMLGLLGGGPPRPPGRSIPAAAFPFGGEQFPEVSEMDMLQTFREAAGSDQDLFNLLRQQGPDLLAGFRGEQLTAWEKALRLAVGDMGPQDVLVVPEGEEPSPEWLFTKARVEEQQRLSNLGVGLREQAQPGITRQFARELFQRQQPTFAAFLKTRLPQQQQRLALLRGPETPEVERPRRRGLTIFSGAV